MIFAEHLAADHPVWQRVAYALDDFVVSPGLGTLAGPLGALALAGHAYSNAR